MSDSKIYEISLRINSELVQLVDASCLNDNFKAKFIKEINECIPILIKYALTEQKNEYFYIKNAQRLSDIVRRVYLSALQKDPSINLSNLIKDMLTIYQQIGQQIDFTKP